MGEVVFTSGALLDLLSQIDELKGKNIALGTAPGRTPELYIDDTTYRLSESGVEDIEVDKETVRDVATLSNETFDEIESRGEPVKDNYEDEDLEPVESGIVKQAIKTLLIGGLVRLTSKLLKQEVRR